VSLESIEVPAHLKNAPYDNSTLRERIGDATVEDRPVTTELQSKANDRLASSTPKRNRRWRWRKH
jgi:hypothetical protein